MVTNPARQETDSLLEDLEKRIAKEYSQAAEELQKKADKYFQGFAERDAKKKALVESGELTEKEYIRWRRGALQHGRRYEDMIADLTNTAVNADKAAMEIVNGSLQDTFRINANYGAYEVERATGIDTSFTLYNKDAVADLIKNQPDLLPKPSVDIPLDKRWNRQHLNSAITQGILQGDSIDSIAKRLRSVSNMDKNAAVRNARTMTTSAENAGAFHSYERAEKMGIKGQKMWMATHDSRTRDSHVVLDGELQNLHDEFSNGLQKPGDPSGDPSEVYNCRCRIVYASDRSQLKQNYDELNKKVVIDGKSYDTWKQESYDKWLARHEKEKPETEQAFIPMAKRSVDFTPAASIKEAEQYAKRFLGYNGSASYKGIDVEYANQCNKVLTSINDNFNVDGLHSIQPMNMRQNIWKNSTSEAAYRWGSGDLFINPQYYKNAKTFGAHKAEIDSLMQTVTQNGQMLLDSGKYSGAKKDYIEALLQSGRQCVSQSYDFVEGTFVHESGHILDDQLFHKEFRKSFGVDGSFGLQERLSESRANFGKNISGYAISSNAEYVAESFTAWWYGESEKLDPILTQAFEGAMKNG